MKRVLSILGILLVCGCTTTSTKEPLPADPVISSISTESIPRRARTYAFHPKVSHVNPDSRLWGLHQMLRSSMEGELNQRGLKKGDPQTADLLVGYVAGLDESFTRRSVDSLFDFPLSSTEGNHRFAPGTVAVVLVNRQVNRAIWRGALQADVLMEVSIQERRQRVNSAVRSLFRQVR